MLHPWLCEKHWSLRGGDLVGLRFALSEGILMRPHRREKHETSSGKSERTKTLIFRGGNFQVILENVRWSKSPLGRS